MHLKRNGPIGDCDLHRGRTRTSGHHHATQPDTVSLLETIVHTFRLDEGETSGNSIYTEASDSDRNLLVWRGRTCWCGEEEPVWWDACNVPQCLKHQENDD